MKYINFKRFKFSALLKYINLKVYSSYINKKYINFKDKFFSIDVNFSIFRRLSYGLKRIDYKEYFFSSLKKLVYSVKRINLRKLINLFYFKNVNLLRHTETKIVASYFIGFIIFVTITYLTIPIFFNYDKKFVQEKLCKKVKIECLVEGKVKYSFYPSPRIKITDLIIKDPKEKNKNFGRFESVEMKLPVFSIYRDKEIDYTNLLFERGLIVIDLNKIDFYNNQIKSLTTIKKLSIKKSNIQIVNNQDNVSNIYDINLKYKSKKKINEIILKGSFLNDDLHLKFVNKRKSDQKNSRNILVKLLNSKIYTEIDFPEINENNQSVNGSILFKQNKNIVSSFFKYTKDKILINNGSLRNELANGKVNGTIKLLPFFNFDLNLDLDGLNFNKFYNFIIKADKKSVENFFNINNKINGQINISTEKIYSKYNLFRSFESKIKFFNSSIFIERLLVDLEKFGAADLTGKINRKKKITNFQYETNIFVDKKKRFLRKFSIYNKDTPLTNLYVSGSFDLTNLVMRFYEMSNEQKFKDEDVSYIEKEFNDLILENGYKTLFNFNNLKDFMKILLNEKN